MKGLKRFGALFLFVGLTLAGCGGSERGEYQGDQQSQDVATVDVGPDTRIDTYPTSISPGVGIGLRDSTLLLGDSLAQVKEKLGEPSSIRDMGAAGFEFEFESAHVGGLLSGSGEAALVTAIYLFDGFGGKTPEGLGIGTTQADWVAAYGSGVKAPFTLTAEYRELGLVAEFDGEKVVRVHVVRSATDMAKCPPSAPFGVKKGDLMADAQFTDVEGNPVTLHSHCGTRLLLAYNYYGW